MDMDRPEPAPDAEPIHRAAWALDRAYKEVQGNPDHPWAKDPTAWFSEHGIKPGCYEEELSFYLTNMLTMLSTGVAIEVILCTMWTTGLQVGYKTRELQETGVLGIKGPGAGL